MSQLQKNKRARDQVEEQEMKKKKVEDNRASEALLNPDILEVVFKDLDFTRLKLNRTVCKTWNLEICRGLRNRSVSYVPAWGDYKRLVEILYSSRKLQLPRIFQTMLIRVESDEMLNQILQVRLPISKLTISEGLGCGSSRLTGRLYELLLQCSSTLTALEIPLCSIKVPKTGGVRTWELEFPLLEELTLTVMHQNLGQNYHLLDSYPGNSKTETRALSFFQNLIDSAPKLSSLEILQESGFIENFLKFFDFDQISNFKLSTDVHERKVAKILRRIEFENLKTLSLHSSQDSFFNSHVQDLLKQNAQTLEFLSLGQVSFQLPECPHLKRLSVGKFTGSCWDLTSFPALAVLEIEQVDKSLLPDPAHVCPASLTSVEIRSCHQLESIQKPLQNLYRFFAGSATTWELPYKYVEDFCDFIAAEKEGKGIKSLIISFEPDDPVEDWSPLTKGLEKTSKLHDLEELALKNRVSELPYEIWNSFSSQLLKNLRTFSCFHHSDFAKLIQEMPHKFKLLRKIVLLRNQPVRFDKKAEEFFSKFPNATSHHEEAVLEEAPKG